MNGKTIEKLMDAAEQQLDVAFETGREQFEGMGPGLTPVDNPTYVALFEMRMAEHGPDFTKALDAKKPDGTDLIPGGRNALRKYLRLRAQMRLQAQMMRTGSAWNPEPYEEVEDGAL